MLALFKIMLLNLRIFFSFFVSERKFCHLPEDRQTLFVFDFEFVWLLYQKSSWNLQDSLNPWKVVYFLWLHLWKDISWIPLNQKLLFWLPAIEIAAPTLLIRPQRRHAKQPPNWTTPLRSSTSTRLPESPGYGAAAPEAPPPETAGCPVHRQSRRRSGRRPNVAPRTVPEWTLSDQPSGRW